LIPDCGFSFIGLVMAFSSALRLRATLDSSVEEHSSTLGLNDRSLAPQSHYLIQWIVMPCAFTRIIRVEANQ